MYKFIIRLSLLFFVQVSTAQERIDLWAVGEMPNSKGLNLKDSIANERIYQVGTPHLQAFYTSQQENKHAAVLIIPGGGYARLAYEISGYQLAKMFNTIGVHAFVLAHRLPGSPDLKEPYIAPLEDAQRAIRVIRAMADSLGIEPDRIGVFGSSAGGHLAASVATIAKDVSAIGDSLDAYPFKPDFQVLISPVIDMFTYAHTGSRDELLGKNPTEEQKHLMSLHEQVNGDTPPAFMVHAFNDKSVSVKNSLLYYNALVDQGISSSLHVFPQGGHAIALSNNPGSTGLWVELMERWLEEIGMLDER